MAEQNDPVTLLEAARKDLAAAILARDAAQGSLTGLQGQVTALTGERDTARGQLSTTQGLLSTAQTQLGAAQGQVTSLTTERDTARGQLSVANTRVTELTASQADFDGRVRADLVKHGVRAEAIKLPKAETGADGKVKGETLTAKCLRMKATGAKE